MKEDEWLMKEDKWLMIKDGRLMMEDRWLMIDNCCDCGEEGRAVRKKARRLEAYLAWHEFVHLAKTKPKGVMLKSSHGDAAIR